MNIADRIQHLRKSKGMSQEELANELGVSRQAISKWENEQSIPDIEKIILLSNFFETTTDFLLKGIMPTQEPQKQELEKKHNAILFAIIGTTLNAIGLIFSIAIWMERQTVFAVSIGLIIMLVGTGTFLLGQFMDVKDKLKAKYLFMLLNIWILLFVPLSCCFNILDGLLSGFSGIPAPIPMLGNSFKTFVSYWIIYITICIVTDISITKIVNVTEQ